MKEPTLSMTRKQDAIRQNPKFPWLSLDEVAQTESFLRDRDWLAADERVVRCEKPGEGNMNLTMRVITNQRSLIVKQSRPWVEKYDHIAAPWDRIEFECRFYERIQTVPSVAARMPMLLYADMDARAIVLEDLGDAQPLTSIYTGDALTDADIRQLADYLATLHGATRGPADSEFENMDMRQLNHQHIFEVPLADNNGIDLEQLETGISASATRLRNDVDYRALVDVTGQRYLETGAVLLQGDYFPGSWLRTANGIFVIDPEFCFFGDPEFDLGCAVAHLRLASQHRDRALLLLQAYTDSQEGMTFESSLVSRYAAVEVMRRLIGVAQLPLQTTNGQRAEMLEKSRDAMVSQDWEKLWN